MFLEPLPGRHPEVHFHSVCGEGHLNCLKTYSESQLGGEKCHPKSRQGSPPTKRLPAPSPIYDTLDPVISRSFKDHCPLKAHSPREGLANEHFKLSLPHSPATSSQLPKTLPWLMWSLGGPGHRLGSNPPPSSLKRLPHFPTTVAHTALPYPPRQHPTPEPSPLPGTPHVLEEPHVSSHS